MTCFAARKLARLCLIALVLTAAAPALAVPPPKGVLGFLRHRLKMQRDCRFGRVMFY